MGYLHSSHVLTGVVSKRAGVSLLFEQITPALSPHDTSAHEMLRLSLSIVRRDNNRIN